MSFSDKKIFISHSSKDKEYVKKFVNLLDSIGVPEKNIVCTSIPGYNVPNGKDIYAWLRSQFTDNNLLVIYMLSENYYHSEPCLNEMGAAWVTGKDGLLILLPGFTFESIRGCINPRMVGLKLDGDEDELKDRLGQLKDRLKKDYNIEIGDTNWANKRNEFIESIKSLSFSKKADNERGDTEGLKPKTNSMMDDISYDEQIFLAFTADDEKRAVVKSVNASGGRAISGGGYEFTNDRSPRNIARWERVVRNLSNKGYIKDKGHSGNLFYVTDKGFNAADEIQKSLNIYVGRGPEYYLEGKKDIPKLSFYLENEPVGDDPVGRSKTSDSDYILEIANTGNIAAMLTDIICVCIKANSENEEDYCVCDCMLHEDERVIQPNTKVRHILEQQDYEALKFHCRELQDYNYDVIAPQLDGLPALEGKLDVSLLVTESFLKSDRFD